MEFEDQDYRPRETGQYPAREDYVEPPKKKSKIHRRLGVILALGLVLGTPYWFAQNYDINWCSTSQGLDFSLVKKEAQEEPVEAIPSTLEEEALPPAVKVDPAPAGTFNEAATLTLAASDQENLTLQEIYAKVRPSVVSIMVSTATGQATGTGMVMSADGYIITNHHVVEGGVTVDVLLADDSILSAQLVGSDQASDLAVLKVASTDLTPAEFGDSNQLLVGDDVVAIGDPLGIELRGTMTDGIISAINRDLQVSGREMTLIQTNAALNSGNSGGPLINLQGQVIGINTMKMGSLYADTTVEGLGFAIPMATAKPIIEQLIDQGYVAGQPYLGITGESLPPAVRAYYHLPAGLYITYVEPSSDAFACGIEAGDVLISLDGEPVASTQQLELERNKFSPGDQVTVQIFRQNVYYELNVTLMDKNAPA